MGAGQVAWPSPTSLQGKVQVIGPLARSVADLRLALGVMQRRAPAEAPAKTGPLRIGWADGTAIGATRIEMVAAMRSAADRLASAGHQVSEHPSALAGCLEAYNHLRAIDPLNDHIAAVAGLEDLVSATCRTTFHDSQGASVAQLSAAWRAALEARATALDLFAEVDVLLIPVAGGPACWPDSTLDINGRTVSGWELMAHCRAVSLTGAPSVSLPIGTSVEGLPLSVQVVAAPWNDEVALRVAAELEAVAT
jgi:amidase